MCGNIHENLIQMEYSLSNMHMILEPETGCLKTAIL